MKTPAPGAVRQDGEAAAEHLESRARPQRGCRWLGRCGSTGGAAHAKSSETPRFRKGGRAQGKRKGMNKTEVFKCNKGQKEVNQVLLPYATKIKVTPATGERQRSIVLGNATLPAIAGAKRRQRLKNTWEVGFVVKHCQGLF